MSCYVQLAADLGGIIGLFLGGSAVSMFEVLDMLVVSMVIHLQSRLHKGDQVGPTSSGTRSNGIGAGNNAWDSSVSAFSWSMGLPLNLTTSAAAPHHINLSLPLRKPGLQLLLLDQLAVIMSLSTIIWYIVSSLDCFVYALWRFTWSKNLQLNWICSKLLKKACM